jgi:hypothetical protein
LDEYVPKVKKETHKKSRVESELVSLKPKKTIGKKQKIVLMVALGLFSVVCSLCAFLAFL